MVKYFAYYEDGVLINIGTVDTAGEVHGEITAEEYERLRAELEPEPVVVGDPVDEALAILRGEVTEDE